MIAEELLTNLSLKISFQSVNYKFNILQVPRFLEKAHNYDAQFFSEMSVMINAKKIT